MEPGWSIEGLVIPTVFAAAYASFLVGIFSRGVNQDLVSTWARSHLLRLTPHSAPYARWYVKTMGVLRVVGGASGVILGAAFDDAFGVDSSAGYGFWAWVIGGWMLGAAWAERRLPRPGAKGSASIVPRQAGDYLPVGLRRAPVVAAAVTVVVAGIAALVATDPFPGALRPPSNDRTFFVAAAAAVGVAAVVVLLQRSIVGRPQPLMAPDLAAVDEAVRSSTLHQVSGAGTAVILCITGAIISLRLDAVGRLPFGVRLWLPLVPLVGVMIAWRLWSFLPWRVRRPLATVEAP